MATIYTLVGLPASGKSTFTKTLKNCVVVSSDEIREQLFGSAECQDNPKLVFDTARKRIAEALKNNKNVIFDATNINHKARKLTLNFDAYQVAIFFTTSAEECKKRNAQRERHVPESVIDRMADRLIAPTIGEGFDEIREF